SSRRAGAIMRRRNEGCVVRLSSDTGLLLERPRKSTFLSRGLDFPTTRTKEKLPLEFDPREQGPGATRHAACDRYRGAVPENEAPVAPTTRGLIAGHTRPRYTTRSHWAAEHPRR